MDPQFFQKVQKGLIVFLIIMAVTTLLIFPEAKVRAPLLTLIGGLVILVPMLNLNKLELLQVAPIVGILVVSGGTYFWLSEATGEKAGITLAGLFLGTVALIAMGAIVIAFFWIITKTNSMQDPDDMIRASRIRRVKRQLREILGDVNGARSSNYSQYDPTISALFRDTWSMLNNPHRTSYAWREHKNLVENYAVARLERTAEIAVTKHPYQCKYGEIAHELAYNIVLGLPPVNLIKVFDPLPDTCPECKEPKPAHKANCMAAICWRCKYPTPPSKARGRSISLITPQCHQSLGLCIPRGEQAHPTDPVVTRIRLPFSIPQDDDSNEYHPGPGWNRDKRKLKDFLEQLQQEEDRVTQT